MEFSGLPYAVARLANVYGPRQRADLEGGVVAIFMERLAAGLPITINGTGHQSRDFVYVTDVADSLLAMVGSDLDGVWNVGTGRAVSVIDLLRAIEGAMGKKADVRHGPPRPGDVNNSRLSVDRIREDLGWRPKYDLTGGLARMIGEPGNPVATG